MKVYLYKVTWEVNQYRPDPFEDLTNIYHDYVYASNIREAEDLSFNDIGYTEHIGGRILKTERA